MQRFITHLLSRILILGLVFTLSMLGMVSVSAYNGGHGSGFLIMEDEELETDELIEKIGELIEDLKEQDVDTAAFEARLINPGEDLVVLLHDVQALWNEVVLESRIEELIAKLDAMEVDTTAFVTRLTTPDEDLRILFTDVRTLWKSLQLAEALRTGIEQLLKKLEGFGVDISAFETRLATQGEDFKVLKKDILAALALAQEKKVDVRHIEDLIARLDRYEVDTAVYAARLIHPGEDLALLEADLREALKDYLRNREHPGPKNKE